jgi:hypothetical protein
MDSVFQEMGFVFMETEPVFKNKYQFFVKTVLSLEIQACLSGKML